MTVELLTVLCAGQFLVIVGLLGALRDRRNPPKVRLDLGRTREQVFGRALRAPLKVVPGGKAR